MSSMENRGDQKDATKSGWTDNSARVRINGATSAYQPVQDNSSLRMNAGPSSSFILVAHPKGQWTERVQCTVVRKDRKSIEGKLYPTYEMILENPRKPLLVARKMKLNRKVLFVP